MGSQERIEDPSASRARATRTKEVFKKEEIHSKTKRAKGVESAWGNRRRAKKNKTDVDVGVGRRLRDVLTTGAVAEGPITNDLVAALVGARIDDGEHGQDGDDRQQDGLHLLSTAQVTSERAALHIYARLIIPIVKFAHR